MNFPDEQTNPLSAILRKANDVSPIRCVELRTALTEPYTVTIDVIFAQNNGTTTIEIQLPDRDLLAFDFCVEEIAWVMGSPDLFRKATSEPSGMERGGYNWRFYPTFGNNSSVYFDQWLLSDQTLEWDGSRKLPYPHVWLKDVVGAAKIYPAAGSGMTDKIDYCTLFEFIVRPVRRRGGDCQEGQS
jgi:hypothetical protein